MKSVEAQIYDLQSRIDTYNNTLNSAYSAVQTMEDKIERLKETKKTVIVIQRNINDINRSLYGKNNQPNWEGNEKKKFDKDFSGFLKDYYKFQNELNQYHDSICDEITRLENSMNEQNGIIGWCKRGINSIGNELNKLFHTKEGY